MANFLSTKIAQLKEYCMQINHSLDPKWPLNVLKTVAFTIGTFFFVIGGVIIGGVAGALKGQTTETGFYRGAGIGVVSGVIVALELLDSFNTTHFLAKVALFGSIFNGKAFTEWVSPAVLKAYQWQMSANDGNISELSDIYAIDEVRGMLPELITSLPIIKFGYNASVVGPCCAICLQDVIEGERARMLGVCSHLFHQHCIDEWLARNASCPTCRSTVTASNHKVWRSSD